MESPSLVIGITGASGSGKSWLSRHIVSQLGESNASILEMDWYYRDLSHLEIEQASRTDFDNPAAIELDLLAEHLDQLKRGEAIEAPIYQFSSFSRLPGTRRVEPTPILIVEGLFILQHEPLRQRMQRSIFIDAPADLRLLRRIRRDMSERRYTLERILDFWQRAQMPSYHGFVEPQIPLADQRWLSEQDKAFVPSLLADLRLRIPGDANPPKA